MRLVGATRDDLFVVYSPQEIRFRIRINGDVDGALSANHVSKSLDVSLWLRWNCTENVEFLSSRRVCESKGKITVCNPYFNVLLTCCY